MGLKLNHNRQWIAALVLVAALSLPLSASVLFDAGDTVTVADNDALTLPAADWTIAGWIKHPGSSSSWRGLMSWGDGDQSVSINIQSSVSYPTNRIWSFYRGSLSTASWTFGGTVGTQTEWVCVVLCRDSNTLRGYSYEDGSEIVFTTTSDISSQGAINASEDMVFGSSGFAGRMAEWAKWDRCLSSAERAAIYAGGKMEEASGGVPIWQFRMFGDYTSSYGSLEATNHGTEVDETEHPVDRGYAHPRAVTNTWPSGYEVVDHRTQIFWTKTPADTTFAQTFTVYLDKSNPPTTAIATDTSDLMVDSGVLDDGATYYLRVDTTAVEGGLSAEGSVVSFTTSATPDHIYYVTPQASASGDESGSDVDNLMGWDDYVTACGASTIESDAVIRLIAPDATIFYEYENIQGSAYTEWPDRIYQSRSVLHYGITQNFQDWRRIGRFITGDYWVEKPTGTGKYLAICSYSPARSVTGTTVRNGMMVNPSSSGQGLDSQYSNHYSAALDHGDEVPYLVQGTGVQTVINCYSAPAGDPLLSVQPGWNYIYDDSILTVLDTGIENNIWFRPSYRYSAGRSVKHQWSDVVTDRIPQMDLDCTMDLYPVSLTTRRSMATDDFLAVEPRVSRAHMELVSNWSNSRACVPWNASYGYAGYYAKSMSIAYLALYDTDLGSLADKKRLLVGLIQAGLDIWGLWEEGQYAWFGSGDGATCIGKYWPVIFAGIMLDDVDMYDHGITTGQDEQFSWTRESNRMDYQENMTAIRLTDDFFGEGHPYWPTPPWQVTTNKLVWNGTQWVDTLNGTHDDTGTVTCTNGSTTVVGQVGETFGTADAGDQFIPITVDGSVKYVNDTSKGLVSSVAYTISSIDRVSSPPTLTLSTAFGGDTLSESAFVISDYVYLGQQYKYSNRQLGELDEFDASWNGHAWWNEKPQSGMWGYCGSAIPAGNTYHSININSMCGMVTAAVLMQDQNKFNAVIKWNEPCIFENIDDYLTNWPGGDGYINGWVRATALAQWTYPVDEVEPDPYIYMANSPSPATGAVSQSLSVTLSWTAGQDIVGHNVYLGTTSGDLSLVSSAQAGTSYSPTLDYDTTYYWRVDEIEDDEDIHTGTEWSFTTESITKRVWIRKGT